MGISKEHSAPTTNHISDTPPPHPAQKFKCFPSLATPLRAFLDLIASLGVPCQAPCIRRPSRPAARGPPTTTSRKVLTCENLATSNLAGSWPSSTQRHALRHSAAKTNSQAAFCGYGWLLFFQGTPCFIFFKEKPKLKRQFEVAPLRNSIKKDTHVSPMPTIVQRQVALWSLFCVCLFSEETPACRRGRNPEPSWDIGESAMGKKQTNGQKAKHVGPCDCPPTKTSKACPSPAGPRSERRRRRCT